MSTKAIRELITLTRPWREEAARKALEEVEAIERAAKAWWVRDDVMERIEDAGHGGFEVVQAIAKEAL